MNHTRSLLFSVAVAALLLCAAPAFAGTGSPAIASGTAPAVAPVLDSGQCTQPAQTAVPAIAAPDSGLFLSTPSDPDFILCSCKFCKNHQDVICRISPTGFSILCSDYYASHCV
jgi:hypothetical protein